MASTDCQHCVGFGRNLDTEEICECSAGRRLKAELNRCRRCDEQGYRWQTDQYAFCPCKHGERLKADRGQEWLDGLTDYLKAAAKLPGKRKTVPIPPQPASLHNPLSVAVSYGNQ